MERSGLYGFLATAFRAEPDMAMIEAVESPAFQDAFGDVFEPGREEALVEELAVEFAALFLGPGGHISPHESVHVKEGGRLLGKASVSVKNDIEACGFDYTADCNVLPDHISVELDFMAEVTRQESEAWRNKEIDKVRNCLEFEEEFSANHLRRWVPDFCNAVAARAELPFYRRIAEITRDFVQEEQREIETLSSLAVSPDFVK